MRVIFILVVALFAAVAKLAGPGGVRGLADWDAPKPKKPKMGRPSKYSNHAIETSVTLGMVFHSASHQTEGFSRSPEEGP